MKITPFHTTKYGKEFLMDLHRIEEIPIFFNSGKPYATNFYEIDFLRKGTGTVQLDHQVMEVKDGSIVYSSPYQRKLWTLENHYGEGFSLIFAQNFLELLFADPLFVFRLQFFHNHKTPLVIQEPEAMRPYHDLGFQRVMGELKDLQHDSEDIIRTVLLMILAEHNRLYCQTYGLTPERSANEDAFRFKKLVEEKIREWKTVEEFAREMKISRVSLNHRVKSRFGLTASQFIKERLATEIQRDLLHTPHSVAEIAHQLRFSEPQHMIRFFKRLRGHTPAQFRAAYQNGHS